MDNRKVLWTQGWPCKGCGAGTVLFYRNIGLGDTERTVGQCATCGKLYVAEVHLLATARVFDVEESVAVAEFETHFRYGGTEEVESV